MADPGLVDLLKQGASAWNAWRDRHPDSSVDLKEADLSGVNLGGLDLRGVALGVTDLRGVDVRPVDLRAVDLGRANLRRADLRWADLRRVNLIDAGLSGADLRGADLQGADLRSADLIEADLWEAHLSTADLSGADLRRANLGRAGLTGVVLRAAYLSAASLNSANLSTANLSGADLSGADLSEALCGWTAFGATDLSTVVGLDSVKHDGPSTIGIDTIYASKGEIPEAFLRGAGVPESFITHMRSLVGSARPIELYSCFISYSSQDAEFARRLYADLQAANVRCWFAPEDLKIGDRFGDEIDQAIRTYDKLLLVLSENSIYSRWVEIEVGRAFRREQQARQAEGGTVRPLVLFPIRLDDSIELTGTDWGRRIRDTRHIGDFRGWESHGSYKPAFDRLLRDLRAGDSRSS